jgi:hypothetical protein
LSDQKFVILYYSDGAVRVFSLDPARQAPEDAQATYAQEVESFMKSIKKELGGVKVTE